MDPTVTYLVVCLSTLKYIKEDSCADGRLRFYQQPSDLEYYCTRPFINQAEFFKSRAVACRVCRAPRGGKVSLCTPSPISCQVCATAVKILCVYTYVSRGL